ncbi:thiol:disulfide interchange protein DsbA/DsbL [Vibrio sonorensis]|uniref:thiol:disulfide interchange protein DsbA/DsbL n=1 Tax=Vibrio sonorensis TaxID=1004316 RepID=UPI0008D90565|nr:thiol:disulfide interchange protein DsbA/DsbL [Vibrio sonorensis]
MKKIVLFFTALLLSINAQAAFQEGKDYKVLDLEKSSKPLVSEFFSFYCPHCYQMEPLLAAMKKQLPEGVRFQKSHVSFMGGPMGKSMSKAYATMIALKAEDKMVPVMFHRIHVLGKAPKDDAELRQIFLDEGIEAKKFDAAFKGFSVDSMSRRFDKQFKSAGLRGVPAVIVNNKYLVQAQRDTTPEQYFDLVNYLLKL